MSDRRLRILNLTNAFPPGVIGRFPAVNPAGHATETRMAEALSRHAELRNVTLLGSEVFGALEPRDSSFGLESELVLWNRPPELWHRWRSWRQLQHDYRQTVSRSGPPDIVLVRNLNPVFNRFVRWLRSREPRPRIVLVFADSALLGQAMPPFRRFRHRFKPMQVPDSVAIAWYDGCISFGIGTEKFFTPLGIPWLWMPSAFNFSYEPPIEAPRTGPIDFGYFGALAAHASVVPMVGGFLDAAVPGRLFACGFGALSGELKALADRQTSFVFDGLLPRQSDCLGWAQKVDVLINPRLNIWGLENSFPSKIFEYAMTGRAILTTATGGVDRVLGDRAFYLDPQDFNTSLRTQLTRIAAMDREALRLRGQAIRAHILREYSWDAQAARILRFLESLKPALA
ncbi:MAG: hypothetical protein KF791_08685 [Verrucomicrobiae bacterium]|nr:hypothetical protein [Verrucomicrobiae bacterium]